LYTETAGLRAGLFVEKPEKGKGLPVSAGVSLSDRFLLPGNVIEVA
jgi:hypothetical protein